MRVEHLPAAQGGSHGGNRRLSGDAGDGQTSEGEEERGEGKDRGDDGEGKEVGVRLGWLLATVFRQRPRVGRMASRGKRGGKEGREERGRGRGRGDGR